MKAPRARALADADGRLLKSRKLDVRFSALKTACKKLFPVKRTRGLRFAAPAGAAGPCRKRRRATLTHAVNVVSPHSTMAADAGTLPAVSIRSRAAATDADSKESASLVTEPITAPHALTQVFGDHLPAAEQQVMVVRRKWTATA